MELEDDFAEALQRIKNGTKESSSVQLTENDDLAHMMSKTEAAMEDPDGKARREAFQNARGAMAAAAHDNRLVPEKDQKEAEFRGDLAQAGALAATAAAPLKLVVSQRVDTAQPAEKWTLWSPWNAPLIKAWTLANI